MGDRSTKYIIAVKRGMHSQLPSEWIAKLQLIDDLSLIGEPRSYRIMVEASPQAIEFARNLLGDYCHIEPLIKHKSVR